MERTEERIAHKSHHQLRWWEYESLQLVHVRSRFQDLISYPASNQDDAVRLHFGLRGQHDFSHLQLKRTFKQVGGQQNILYSQNFDIEVQNKSLEIETFGIRFSVDQFVHYTAAASPELQRFADRILQGKGALLSQSFRPITAPMHAAIQSVLRCGYTGEMRRLFLTAKSLELLVHTAESHAQPLPHKSRFLVRPGDRDKIFAARDLVEQRLAAPPGLDEIAREVGLNVYKLKGGFKEVFGTTVFGHLRAERLRLAMRDLRDTQKTATEIAMDLGYASPQHFSTAFKQKYGITPASVRNNP